MISRRTFLPLLTGAAAGSAFTASRPQNLVVALCDDLGYRDLGCYGHPAIRTPNLDKFAGEGMRFTDFYAAAPVCSPSRAGLLTGRTPNRCGVYDWIPENSPVHLRRDEMTWARVLRDAGYATCLSGKWHLNGLFNSPQQPQPGDHGFQHWFATQNNALPSHENPINFVRNGKAVGPLQGYSSQVIVSEALQWLEGLDGKQPFCLFVAFHSPHEPIATAEEFTGLYPQATEKGKALYYGNVTQMDHEFGRLMGALQQRGLRDNTMVMFTSDNGPETLNRYPGAWRSHGSAAPLRSMKLSMYEGGYRVPGIVRWPGQVQPARVSSTPACALDLMPTLCEIAGVAAPKGRQLDGSSLVPFLHGKPLRRERPLHWHYFNALDRPRASMRDGDWKILGLPASLPHGKPGSSFQPSDIEYIRSMELTQFELYNLKDDPSESVNLAGKQETRLRAMSQALLRLHEEVKKESPAWN